MRGIDKYAARALFSAIVVTVCLLATIVTAKTIEQLAAAGPHAGDILVFSPSAYVPSGDAVRLAVHRPDRFGCILDMDVLRRSGGSLIVEAEAGDTTKHFRVHWAGARTSADASNCGSDADLVVDRRDLDVAALSAGGYGVGVRHVPVFTSDIGQ